MTYDQQRPGQERLRSQAFAMFYGAINIGAAITSFSMPFIRDHFGYALAFLFPAVLMAVAFLVFAAGKPYYARETIQRERKTDAERREQWAIVGRLASIFIVVSFFWSIFDQSASTWIVFARDYLDLWVLGVRIPADLMQSVNPILILVLLPPLTILWQVLDERGIKLRATDKMMVGFILTTATMALTAALAMSTRAKEPIPIRGKNIDPRPIERLYVQIPEIADVWIEASPHDPDRLQAALTLVSGATLTSKAIDEHVGKAREKLKLPEELVPSSHRFVSEPARDKVSVLWQVVAFILITTAEICVSVVGLELAFTAAPASMKSFVTAIWLLTVFVGNIFNSQFTPLYDAMTPARFFSILTILMVVVTLAFFFVARRFNRQSAA